MWNYNYEHELYHHGIQGMKWGVRHDRERLDIRRSRRNQDGNVNANVERKRLSKKQKIAIGVGVGAAATATALFIRHRVNTGYNEYVRSTMASTRRHEFINNMKNTKVHVYYNDGASMGRQGGKHSMPNAYDWARTAPKSNKIIGVYQPYNRPNAGEHRPGYRPGYRFENRMRTNSYMRVVGANVDDRKFREKAKLARAYRKGHIGYGR